MKKKLKILLTIIASCVISSCGNASSSDSTLQSQESITDEDSSGMNSKNVDFTGDNLTYKSYGDVEGSIHQYKQEKTTQYVVKDGKSDYKIVIPNDASVRLRQYVNEFVSLFAEGTNIELDIVSEKDFTNNGKFISIGNTELFENSNIKLNYDQLLSQGFIIKTINQAIYINGFSDGSCLYGMYKYLEFNLNYDFFGPSTYYIDKGVNEISLYTYDVIDAPDVEFRMSSYSFANGLGRKYTLSDEDPFMTINGGKWHNSFICLPKNVYQSTHPEWYSNDGTQLCYTAHGNQQSFELMTDTVAKEIEKSMIENPTKTVVTLTIEDSNTFCDCEKCKESKLHYNGANSAVVVKFLNRVSDKIHEWYKTPEGALQKRDLKILFFAYLSTNIAPTNFQKETSTYSPVDNEVVCNDDVCVFFADIRGDYTHSFYDTDSANVMFINNMKAWTTCSKEFFFWMYSTNFSYYLTPYNSFDAAQNTYKFAVENHVKYIFDQGQWNQGSSATGWSFLKQYLSSKLLWNVNLNQDELIDKFFKYFYSESSGKVMKKLFDEYRVLAKYQNDSLGYSGESSIYHNPLKAEYWPKNTLIRWIDMLDDAIEKLSSIARINPGMYDTYLNNIRSERVAYVYLLLKIYNSSLSDEELVNYKKIFHKDTDDTGMLYESEVGSFISDILK